MRGGVMTPDDGTENRAMVRALADVIAKQQITDVIHRYCRGLDRMDREMALSIWHADAVVDYGSTFQGTCTDFIDRAWAIHAAMLAHFHQVSNILIDLDGNRATSEAYFTAVLRSLGEEGSIVQLTVRGRYLDEWSWRDARWAIERRVVAHDFSDRVTVTDTAMASSARRDLRDPSYQFLSKATNTVSHWPNRTNEFFFRNLQTERLEK